MKQTIRERLRYTITQISELEEQRGQLTELREQLTESRDKEIILQTNFRNMMKHSDLENRLNCNPDRARFDEETENAVSETYDHLHLYPKRNNKNSKNRLNEKIKTEISKLSSLAFNRQLTEKNYLRLTKKKNIPDITEDLLGHFIQRAYLNIEERGGEERRFLIDQQNQYLNSHNSINNAKSNKKPRGFLYKILGKK